eukprot:TRINITY_DN6987_c0_g1_i1.p1 TRINITY_DN6987_c0_g1~~TRINITY_DN6987_c0_g1_i1.p1  ORF type:complete len:766 (-),score=136.41 TRINITY_DN6987_c0_g1_i1:29-2212(-)
MYNPFSDSSEEDIDLGDNGFTVPANNIIPVNYDNGMDSNNGIEVNGDSLLKSLSDSESCSSEESLDLESFWTDISDSEIKQFLDDPGIKDAFDKGVDLTDFCGEILEELHEVELENAVQYIEKGDDIVDIYDKLTFCEDTLDKIDNVIGNFGNTLAAIAKDIREQQKRSQEDLVKLNNRKEIEGKLSQFLNDIDLPKNLIRIIARSKINRAYVEYLSIFEAKCQFVEKTGSNVKVVNEQKKKIDALITKACSKIHKWLLSKLDRQFRNVQSLNKLQDGIIRYKPIFTFLKSHQPEKSEEIIERYQTGISVLFYTHIRYYINRIGSLQYQLASKNDIIGEPESKIQNFFTSVIELKNRGNVYSLATRQSTLNNLEEILEFPEGKEKKPYEYLYRCLIDMFITSADKEDKFNNEFFGITLSENILSRSIALLNQNLESFLSSCFDCIGILILQCIYHKHFRNCTKRNLIDYFATSTNLLRDRFNYVLDMHINSLLNAKAKNYSEIDLRTPHYVMRRYSEFIISILVLCNIYPGAVIQFHMSDMMEQLRTNMAALLVDMSETFTKHNEKEIFIINNVNLILTLAEKRTILSPDIEFWETILAQNSDAYAQNELRSHFNELVSFIDAHWDRETDQITDPGNEDPIIEIAELFYEDNYWKSTLHNLNSSILKLFSNFDRGIMIMRKIGNELLVYYGLLERMVNQFYRDISYGVRLTTSKQIRYELKLIIPQI